MHTMRQSVIIYTCESILNSQMLQIPRGRDHVKMWQCFKSMLWDLQSLVSAEIPCSRETCQQTARYSIRISHRAWFELQW
jgi:hypothetical protein